MVAIIIFLSLIPIYAMIYLSIVDYRFRQKIRKRNEEKQNEEI